MDFVIVVVVVLAAFLVVSVVHTTSKETRVGIKEDLTEIKNQLELDLNELATRIEAKIAEAGTPVDVSAELDALRAVGARMDATLVDVPDPTPAPPVEPGV